MTAMTAGTAQSVDGLGFKSWWWWDFLVPIQIDPKAYPDLCTKSTRSLLG